MAPALLCSSHTPCISSGESTLRTLHVRPLHLVHPSNILLSSTPVAPTLCQVSSYSSCRTRSDVTRRRSCPIIPPGTPCLSSVPPAATTHLERARPCSEALPVLMSSVLQYASWPLFPAPLDGEQTCTRSASQGVGVGLN